MKTSACQWVVAEACGSVSGAATVHGAWGALCFSSLHSDFSRSPSAPTVTAQQPRCLRSDGWGTAPGCCRETIHVQRALWLLPSSQGWQSSALVSVQSPRCPSSINTCHSIVTTMNRKGTARSTCTTSACPLMSLPLETVGVTVTVAVSEGHPWAAPGVQGCPRPPGGKVDLDLMPTTWVCPPQPLHSRLC